jgi:antitoxin (DNA-binding transcriptional repressor) of toxin-antitoxin stability system
MIDRAYLDYVLRRREGPLQKALSSVQSNCTREVIMTTVSVSNFRANMMAFLKKVQQGETLSVISRGHKVATIVPPVEEKRNALNMLKKIRKECTVRDIISPCGSSWEAMK